MLEAFRVTGDVRDQTTKWNFPANDPRTTKLHQAFPEVTMSSDPAVDNSGEFFEAARALGFQPKPEGVGAEAADVLVRLLDTCIRYDIDLFAEWRRKVNYNWTRPARHGGKAL